MNAFMENALVFRLQVAITSITLCSFYDDLTPYVDAFVILGLLPTKYRLE